MLLGLMMVFSCVSRSKICLCLLSIAAILGKLALNGLLEETHGLCLAGFHCLSGCII